MLTNRTSLCYTLATTIVFGALFGFINSAQQVYVGIYGLGVWFPGRLRRRRRHDGGVVLRQFAARRPLRHAPAVAWRAGRLLAWSTRSGSCLSLLGQVPLAVFVRLFAAAMLQFGWIGSNFNSIAMEPLGHVAGTASSVIGFMQTLGGGVHRRGDRPGVRRHDRRRSPPASARFPSLGLVIVLIAERGKLFRAQANRRAEVGRRRAARACATRAASASPAKSKSLRSSRCDGRTLASARIIVSLRPGMRALDVVEHRLHGVALQPLLAAAKIAGDDREAHRLGEFREVGLGAVAERPQHHRRRPRR